VRSVLTVIITRIGGSIARISQIMTFYGLRDRKSYLRPYRSRWTICSLDRRRNFLGPSAQ